MSYDHVYIYIYMCVRVVRSVITAIARGFMGGYSAVGQQGIRQLMDDEHEGDHTMDGDGDDYAEEDENEEDYEEMDDGDGDGDDAEYDDDDHDEEEGEEEEEVDGGEAVEGATSLEADDDDDDDDEEGLQEMEMEYLQDIDSSSNSNSLINSKKKKKDDDDDPSQQGMDEPVLPMYEDLSAHALLKRLMQFERDVERRNGIGESKHRELLESDELMSLLRDDRSKGHVEVEDSFWVDPYSLDEHGANDDGAAVSSSSRSNSLAHILLSLLARTVDHDDVNNDDRDDTTNNGFDQWLQQNRSCFNLVRLFSIPSTIALLNQYITREQWDLLAQKDNNSSSVASSSSQLLLHEGGKVLIKLSKYVANM